jgi:hypothetical protein
MKKKNAKNKMSLCSIQREGCQRLLLLEAEVKWGGQEAASSLESSITVKGSMHCWTMSSRVIRAKETWISDPGNNTRVRKHMSPTNVANIVVFLSISRYITRFPRCYPSFCMRPTLVNFFTTLVIFSTRAGLQVDGALDGLGVVSPLDDFGCLGWWLMRWCSYGCLDDGVLLGILTYHREIALQLAMWCSSLHLC